MKLLTSSAIALAAAFIATPAVAQYGDRGAAPVSTPQPDQQHQANDKAQGKPQLRPSSKALKPLSELQAAIKSKDEAAIAAKTAAAQAVVSTKEDRAILAQLQLEHAADKNDKAAAMAAMDAILAAGVLSPAETVPLLQSLSGLRYDAKQYDQAAAVIDKRLQLNPNDIDAIGLLAETRNAQGRVADAVAALERGIQLQSAGGRKPDENWVKRATALAYNAKLPNAPELARQWVAAYPSPTSWRDAIAIYRNTIHPQGEGLLDLLRLEAATGALSDPNDYSLYATSAAEQDNYVEALAILNQGVAAKQIDPANPDFARLIAAVKAKPQTTEAGLAEATKMAVAPTALVRIGDRYYGMSNYAKALENYRLALAKPGVDANTANLHIGMALARSGDKAGAAAAFAKVGGPLTEIAKYWLLYVQGA